MLYWKVNNYDLMFYLSQPLPIDVDSAIMSRAREFDVHIINLISRGRNLVIANGNAAATVVNCLPYQWSTVCVLANGNTTATVVNCLPYQWSTVCVFHQMAVRPQHFMIVFSFETFPQCYHCTPRA